MHTPHKRYLLLLLLQSALQPLWVLDWSTIVQYSQQEGFYGAPLPAARQTPNLEDQWLERSNSLHQVSPTSETPRANPSSGRWNYGREIAENFAESGDFHVTLGYTRDISSQNSVLFRDACRRVRKPQMIFMHAKQQFCCISCWWCTHTHTHTQPFVVQIEPLVFLEASNLEQISSSFSSVMVWLCVFHYCVQWNLLAVIFSPNRKLSFCLENANEESLNLRICKDRI